MKASIGSILVSVFIAFFTFAPNAEAGGWMWCTWNLEGLLKNIALQYDRSTRQYDRWIGMKIQSSLRFKRNDVFGLPHPQRDSANNIVSTLGFSGNSLHETRKLLHFLLARDGTFLLKSSLSHFAQANGKDEDKTQDFVKVLWRENAEKYPFEVQEQPYAKVELVNANIVKNVLDLGNKYFIRVLKNEKPIYFILIDQSMPGHDDWTEHVFVPISRAALETDSDGARWLRSLEEGR